MTPKTKKTTPVIEIEEAELIDQTPEETVTFKLSHFYSVLVVLAFAVGILVGYVAWGRDVPVAVAAQQAPSGPVVEAPVTQEPKFIRYDIPTEGFPSFGPQDAKIVIVEFSDFQCPYCRRFHEQTYQSLLKAYPGQIRFVYRNLPLPATMHPDAMSAAVASLCANDQNAYWDYHEKLFSSESLGNEIYIQYATELGLNVEEFTACLSSGKHDDYIKQDMAFSSDLGVQSTPTFFVNGLALVGAQPLASFQQLIDKDLAGEIPQ